MSTAERWLQFLGVPAATIAFCVLVAWILKEKIAAIVFWALREYPTLHREAAEKGGAFDDLFKGDPLARLQNAFDGQASEIKSLREIIREDLAPLAALGPKLTDLDYSVKSLSAEAHRLAKAVENVPSLVTAVELLKQQINNQPRGRAK